MDKIPFTIFGLDKIKSELIKLKKEDRPAIIKAISVAREHGDLKENAEYHAAKEQQSFAEGRIQDIKLKFIGEINKLPIKLKKIIRNAEIKTSKNSSLQVNIALNYGSKNELINSIKNIRKKKIKINEKNIDNNLFTKNIIDPDILIRTGNTQRLSNFMLWQLAYTEIFFEKKLWPDFKCDDFKKILNKFRLIKRNFGSI